MSTETTETTAPEVIADAPPARPAPRRRTTAKPKPEDAAKPAAKPVRKAAGKRTPKVNISEGVAQLYAGLGLGLSMMPSKAMVSPTGPTTQTALIGQALMANAADLGAAWQKAAEQDDRIKEAIERLLGVSVAGAIISAHLPIALAVMQAYGPPIPGLSMGAPSD